MNNLKVKISLAVLAIIIGSSILIFGYHWFANGNRLNQSPGFDLSIYDELTWDTPQEFIEKLNADDEVVVENQAQEQAVQLMAEKIKQETSIQKPIMYFSEFFLADTATQTKTLVRNFLNDYPVLKNYSYHDFLAKTCYQFEVNGEVREQELFDLQAGSVAIIEFENDSNKKGTACFAEPIYFSEAYNFFKEKSLTMIDLPVETPQYIVEIVFDNEEQTVHELGELKNQNSNLFIVVF